MPVMISALDFVEREETHGYQHTEDRQTEKTRQDMCCCDAVHLLLVLYASDDNSRAEDQEELTIIDPTREAWTIRI
jgi:hypothetical protein